MATPDQRKQFNKWFKERYGRSTTGLKPENIQQYWDYWLALGQPGMPPAQVQVGYGGEYGWPQMTEREYQDAFEIYLYRELDAGRISEKEFEQIKDQAVEMLALQGINPNLPLYAEVATLKGMITPASISEMAATADPVRQRFLEGKVVPSDLPSPVEPVDPAYLRSALLAEKQAASNEAWFSRAFGQTGPSWITKWFEENVPKVTLGKMWAMMTPEERGARVGQFGPVTGQARRAGYLSAEDFEAAKVGTNVPVGPYPTEPPTGHPAMMGAEPSGKPQLPTSPPLPVWMQKYFPFIPKTGYPTLEGGPIERLRNPSRIGQIAPPSAVEFAQMSPQEQSDLAALYAYTGKDVLGEMGRRIPRAAPSPVRRRTPAFY